MKRAVKWTALILFVVLIVGGVTVLLTLDGIVRSTVESQATQSMKLQTKLGAASLSLFGGKVELKELKIASPPGFKAPEMFALDRVAVQVSYSQLTKQPIHITEIVIDRPRLAVEQTGLQVNLKAAMDQMPKSESPSDIKLIIDKLVVTNTAVTVTTQFSKEKSLTLPTITMTNIGNADGAGNGAAIKDVVAQLLGVMAGKISESGGLSIDAGKMLDKQLDEVKGKALEEAAKKGVGSDLTNGLGGLLGGKKDPKK